MDIMRGPEPFAINYQDMPNELQLRAQRLCWRFNQLDPADTDAAQEVLRELLGTCPPGRIGVKQSFRCDYGFNIHLHGYVLVNYNCTFLDTSPINIGAGTLIAPGCVLACAGHALHPEQRAEGIQTSAPITIGEGVLDRRERRRVRGRDHRGRKRDRRGQRRYARRARRRRCRGGAVPRAAPDRRGRSRGAARAGRLVGARGRREGTGRLRGRGAR